MGKSKKRVNIALALLSCVFIVSIFGCLHLWTWSLKKVNPFVLIEEGIITNINQDDLLFSDNNESIYYITVRDFIYQSNSLKDRAYPQQEVAEKEYIYIYWCEYSSEYLFFSKNPSIAEIKTIKDEMTFKPLTASGIWFCFLLMGIIFILIYKNKYK